MQTTAMPRHGKQHEEVYINMISFLSNIPITELIVDPFENAEEDDDDLLSAPGHGFGHKFPGFTDRDAPATEAAGKEDAPVPVVKSASLVQTENITWLLLQQQHEKMPGLSTESFGSLLFQTMPTTAQTLSHVLDMLGRAELSLFFHPLIYHIATIVAFQHYVRLTVLRTGQFAPQRTMNLQQSYLRTLLVGLFNTHLTDPQRLYVRNHVWAPV